MILYSSVYYVRENVFENDDCVICRTDSFLFVYDIRSGLYDVYSIGLSRVKLENLIDRCILKKDVPACSTASVQFNYKDKIVATNNHNGSYNVTIKCSSDVICIDNNKFTMILLDSLSESMLLPQFVNYYANIKERVFVYLHTGENDDVNYKQYDVVINVSKDSAFFDYYRNKFAIFYYSEIDMKHHNHILNLIQSKNKVPL